MSERQGFGLLQTQIGTIFSASMTSTTSSIDVTDFSKISLQPVYTVVGNSTGSLTVQSSLDGNNWFTDFSFTAMSNTSSFQTISTKRTSIRALNAVNGNITGSLYFLAGN